VEIRFDDVVMASGGIFAGGDAEAAGTRVLQQKEFKVTIDLKLGSGEAAVYTSDLSYDYVRINADYRT
jgi:glutamate N-acetyltransferase/amino-acid N-acetyltransferase